MPSRSGVFTKWNGDEVKKRAERLAELSPFEIGLVVQGNAKLLAPVAIENGGRLRASITTASGTGKRTRPSGINAVDSDIIEKPNESNETFVGTPVYYGPYVEYGTFRMAAQPFLRPALDMAMGRALSIVQVGAKKQFGEYLNPKAIFGQTNEAFTE
jgi:hypothetical protein